MGSERLKDLLEEVAGLLGAAAAGGRSLVLELDALQKRTRKQLLSVAKKLGLTGVSKLRKGQLAERVQEALKARGREKPPSRRPEDGASATSPAPAGAATPAAGREPAAAAKLDLGPGARDETPVEHIPWSYGVDRITAAAVDPDRLYVFWEVTDPAIERARAGLGPGGPGAWLSLRVYDTTGLIFDGTNAHSYFDHPIGRSDRQWFFTVNKPSSTAYVEVGMKSGEGFFVRIARSGRVDFPRKELASWSEPEWMTVLATTGQPQPAGTGVPARRTEEGPPAPRADSDREPPWAFTPIPLWVLHESATGNESRARELLSRGWERVEWHEAAGTGWFELESHVQWEGPLTVTTWEAGPFAYPVEISQPLRQEWQGRSVAYTDGHVTHLIHGPWQVVIRNLGAHHGRSVVGRWEVYRSWVAEGGREVRIVARPGQASALQTGASELAAGASERLWLAASELRLGGASEIRRMGASEVLFRGASERLFAGASQWMIRGASERLWLGMSETLMRGASERLLGGASERLGASERHLGASEQRFEGGPATPLPYPPPPDAYFDRAE